MPSWQWRPRTYVSLVFATLLFLAAGVILRDSRAQYGQDTGNPAATFHEVRVWKEEHEPKNKALIPLRMVRCARCTLRLDAVVT